MPILRLAYIALFLIALMAVFTLWSQVGGQGHLDLVPWSLKLALGCGAAYAIARAGMAAVAGEHGWNGHTVKWVGLTLALLFLCGMASFYAHNNLEDTGDETGESDATVSQLWGSPPGLPSRVQLGDAVLRTAAGIPSRRGFTIRPTVGQDGILRPVGNRPC